MAGMEQLQIHSKSYLLRWVEARSEHVISWSVQAQKKGLNFGIFKHPGSKVAPTPKLGSSATFTNSVESPPGERDGAPDPMSAAAVAASEGRNQAQRNSTAVDKLKSLGYRMVLWHGYCEANQIATGTYEVPEGEGGMYALVFDNTFAKSHSKLVNLALMTYPAAGGLPQSSHLLVRPANERRNSAMFRPPSSATAVADSSTRPGTSAGTLNSVESGDGNVYEGVLLKRRRKKGQGYARRFFSLDLESSTLAYYHDQKSNLLRGIIPLGLAAVATNEKTKEISIDSGAEVWHLRAGSTKEYTGWKDAIESASRHQQNNAGDSLSPTPRKSQPQALIRRLSALQLQQGHDIAGSGVDWHKTEGITKRIEQARNAARQLAKDTDPKYFSPYEPSSSSPSISRTGSDLQNHDAESPGHCAESPGQEDGAGSAQTTTNGKRPFWGRKSSGNKSVKSTTPGQRNVSGQSTVPSISSLTRSQEDLRKPAKTAALPTELEGVHEQCMSLYRNLDSVIRDLQTLLNDSKPKMKLPTSIPAHMMEVASRLSMESSFSQEFFDAEMGASIEIPMLTIQHDEHEREPSILLADGAHDDDPRAGSASEIEDEEDSGAGADALRAVFPAKPKPFSVGEAGEIVRRTTVAAPTVQPPSLIAFLRKNVGKDLSTISMPVSANEPLSLTQKAAEMMEYSALLDRASDPSLSKAQRLLYVTAFAISALSSLRVKERAIRKPFNPMLGETYEMVREDLGLRFVAEKVSHRPVVIACQADSARGRWSLSQSASPTQKFWGKSAELVTEGRVRLMVHATGERFWWSAPTCFLRNVLAGEKYVEPVGAMHVTCDTTGMRADAVFKAKGMFSGRSEEVTVTVCDAYGDPQPDGLDGRWTANLALTEHGAVKGGAAGEVWVADALPANAAKAYGFTGFAAGLNELSARDRPHVPPTDSRLRPDQRALEEGDVDGAEELKAALEEAQRTRRREMEERGDAWSPMWFAKVDGHGDGEDTWRLRSGRDGYWERRARDDWKGVVDVLEV